MCKIISKFDIVIYIVALLLFLFAAGWGSYYPEQPIAIPGLNELIKHPFLALVLFISHTVILAFLIIPALQNITRTLFLSGVLFAISIIGALYISLGPFVIILLVTRSVYMKSEQAVITNLAK